MSTENQVAREIVDLHVFFQEWFRGVLPRNEEAFSRFDSALDSDFVLVSPDGQPAGRSTLVPALYEMHAAHEAIEIWVESPQLIFESSELLVASYDEYQRTNGATTGRISTVIFRRAPDLTTGLRWLRVHETWLPSDEASSA